MSSFPASPEDASECTPVLNQSLTAKLLSKAREKKKNGAIGPQEKSLGFLLQVKALFRGSGLHPALLLGLFIRVAGDFFFFNEIKKVSICCRSPDSFGFEKEGIPFRT